MAQSGADRDGLCVRFGVYQARKSVTRVAADATTVTWVCLIEKEGTRCICGVITRPRQYVSDLLNTRLMADRRMRIWRAARRIRGVVAAPPVHVVELFSFSVIGFQIL